MERNDESKENKVQFVPFSSCIDPSFWHKLAQLKLDVDMLNEPVRKIWGYHSNVLPRGLKGILSVDCSSFNESPDDGNIVSVGKIINKNTWESFKSLDRSALLAEEGKELIESFQDAALDDPRLLSRFLVVCFADLKQHKFTYWFAFPAINAVVPRLDQYIDNAAGAFSQEDLEEICSVIDRKQSFGVLDLTEGARAFYGVREGFEKIKKGLIQFSLVCSDSCLDESYCPGWPLRNYLALFAYHCQAHHTLPVTVICTRYEVLDGKWSLGQSLVLHVIVAQDEIIWNKTDICVGMEMNGKGSFKPRVANLNSSMNPISLAESSVDLNLKLMKWQVLPDINLDLIRDTKCLLLGAGTLGCVVARCLLGWGVRHMTLVDNSNVSYSNPVRQNLYQFVDVGKPKAPVAAAALRSIFPSVVSNGKVMSIPMPGHPVGTSLLEEVKQTIANLDELIRQHDVIFLLMDSRESRWLPTVMGAAHGKIVINAALGFDSYLVIRHGLRATEDSPALASTASSQRLGCYFCSDVTAPGNSGQSRTLDQQCTVTRPGVSNIAGSLAVELMVSVLQHEAQGAAPATTQDGLLGRIPHSIRGFLSSFEEILPAIPAFNSCVGCSDPVVAEYKSRAGDFVLDVLESKKYLEELTGLAKLHQENILDDILILEDSDDEN